MTSSDFRVRRRWVGPVHVITPTGALDSASTAAMTEATAAALRRARSVVVDLSAVTSMEAEVAHLLAELAEQAHACRGRLRVAALPEHAHRLFAQLELYEVLGGRGDVATECRSAISHLAGTHQRR
ncbi:STAS domain-containing protein [Kineococcus sp. SYSU DK005]|uniref:STAS domain-containing protein n=1 Tax=Kineococcus sp. SYSU DK005 TaxID=3383126 RepID=UPI003D7C92F2